MSADSETEKYVEMEAPELDVTEALTMRWRHYPLGPVTANYLAPLLQNTNLREQFEVPVSLGSVTADIHRSCMSIGLSDAVADAAVEVYVETAKGYRRTLGGVAPVATPQTTSVASSGQVDANRVQI
jgi:hypothetical protein